MSEEEFKNAKYSLFILSGKHEDIDNNEQILEWHLKSEAFFSYISYMEYKESSKNARIALWFAAVSIIISIISSFAN